MPPTRSIAALRRVSSALALAVLLSLAVTPCGAAADAGPVRLVDRSPEANGLARIIDGTWRRVLPAFRGREVLSLEGAPPNPHLRVSLGLNLKEKDQGKVRFQVVLRRKNRAPKLVYEHDLDRTGWVDANVDLGTDLEGAELLFQKFVVEGTRAVFAEAAWGEPMLVAGAAAPGTSLILISIDTLRSDQLGVYGNAKVRTPTFDALATGGVWYANSYSASTWTYPSHASLLYGLYPASLPPLEALATATPTSTSALPHNLPEVLRDHGYITAGFTGGGYMSDRWGFTTGFDTYYMFPQPAQIKGCTQDRFDGPVVFDRAARWLHDNSARPFFLFVHTYDVHDRCPIWPAGVGALDPWPDPGPAGRQKVVDYYDSLVERADTLIAGLMDELQSLGIADRVAIAITGDHGEGFWEKGFYGHGCLFTPYEPLVHVPLIVRPARDVPARGRIDAPVSAVDVAPTLLALAGVQAPPSMQGYVLPGLGIKPNQRPESAPIFVQCQDKLVVRVGAKKLISTGKPPKVHEELYDLQRDPGETANLVSTAADDAVALRAHAGEYRQHGSMEAGARNDHLEHLDEQTKERLRALGYLE